MLRLCPYCSAVLFTLVRVPTNRSGLLVLLVGVLLGAAALVQTLRGDSASSSSEATSATTSQVTKTTGEDQPCCLDEVPTSSTTTSSVSAPTTSSTPTTSTDYPLSVSDTDQGVLRVSGYGPKEFQINHVLSKYRTATFRNEDNSSGLTVELRDSNGTSIAVFGHAASAWPIQGLRDVRDVIENVVKIVVGASNAWTIEFLPEAFLWDKELARGNTPQPNDFSVLSADGIAFVGTDAVSDAASGTGDLLIYNACQGCGEVRSVIWTLRLDPRCDHTPTVLIKKLGEDFFQRDIRPLKTGSGEQQIQVTLDGFDWLQVLTPCKWSVAPQTQ